MEPCLLCPFSPPPSRYISCPLVGFPTHERLSRQVYEHYKGLMAESFDGSPGFSAVLDEACKAFINAVPRASEWLARYAHCLLDKV